MRGLVRKLKLAGNEGRWMMYYKSFLPVAKSSRDGKA